ncbi:MAG: hypothetical protein MUO63_03300, partial [Desulfobulbaceae bacterium]|nr:hypothetical protein [Desulfobulbaceae bacterium]
QFILRPGNITPAPPASKLVINGVNEQNLFPANGIDRHLMRGGAQFGVVSTRAALAWGGLRSARGRWESQYEAIVPAQARMTAMRRTRIALPSFF